MVYSLKEVFLTLQGEGARAGRRAVFCRFSGCNLWTGRPEHRAAAVCRFCDTDFVGTDGTNGGRYTAAVLASLCSQLWGPGRDHRYVVLTGGEPMLQVDRVLIDTFHRFDFRIAVETNGTIRCPDSLDWVTVSPKAGADPVQREGQELKLVYPQEGAEPERYADLAFRHRYLQPMWVEDEAERERNVRRAVAYCLDHPPWRLSMQVHKLAGLR